MPWSSAAPMSKLSTAAQMKNLQIPEIVDAAP
jgi:hypothetical protein